MKNFDFIPVVMITDCYTRNAVESCASEICAFLAVLNNILPEDPFKADRRTPPPEKRTLQHIPLITFLQVS